MKLPLNGRSRRIAVVVGVVTLTVAVLAAVLLRADRTDPRVTFVKAANPLCDAELVTIAALDPVGEDDPLRERQATARALADAAVELAAAAAALSADGDATELRSVLVGAARERAELYADAAETGDPPPVEAVAKTYETARVELAAWAPTTCGRTTFPGADRVEEVSAAAVAAETACVDAAARMAVADTAAAAGELDSDEYTDRLAEITGQLASELSDAADATKKDPQGDWSALADAVAETSKALGEGDLDAVAEAEAQWVELADSEQLPQCDGGIVASVENPSGILAAPDLPPAESHTGSESGDVTDAELFSQIAAELLTGASGVDPENSFGVPLAVPSLADGLVTVDGDTAASATAVSVADPVTSNGGGASEQNPWVLRITVGDTSGRCAAARLFGYPTLTGFESLGLTERCDANSVSAELPADR